MASSRKTMFLDILQLNSLKFYTTSNSPIPSSLVLTAKGNGETYFTSISSLVGSFFQNIATPGQVTINSPSTTATLNISSLTNELFLSTNNVSSILFIGVPVVSTVTSTIRSVQASTMFNILNYPNILSSIAYNGIVGRQTMSTLANSNSLTNSGDALFSSFQTTFSNFSCYINPNGSSRMFIDYYPNFTFAPAVTPSSISSLALYPEGNSSIKSVISLSTHFMYVNSAGSNIPVNKSGIQQYIPINASYPYGVSSFINPRVLSNTYVTPMRLEFDTSVINSNVSLVHYISDGIGSVKTVGGNDVFRTGFQNSTFVINTRVNDNNILFVNINNSGNAF
jgi:hypothetical protein